MILRLPSGMFGADYTYVSTVCLNGNRSSSSSSSDSESEAGGDANS